MSEHTPHNPNTAQNPEMMVRFAAYDAQLEAMGAQLPEIEGDKELIREGAHALIEEFGLHEELVKQESHAFFLSALGQRYGHLEQVKDQMPPEDYARERDFIYDATALLARDKSDIHDEYHASLETHPDAPEELRLQVYDEYTDPELSAELRRAVDAGLIDDVKAQMGVTSENETPYNIRVLNIGDDFYGMNPQMPEGLSQEPWGSKGWEDYNKAQQDHRDYEARLQANAEDFMRKLNIPSLPPAWQTEIAGVQTLVLPAPFAEKILRPEARRADYYKAEDLDRDMAFLKHEYTHTQQGVNLDKELFYGIAVEERRAELFSGDKHGYSDVKQLFTYTNVISGIDVVGFLREEVKGGTTSDFFKKLAKEAGLQRSLEFALTPPSAYANDERPLQKHVAEYLGGFDGFMRRLYDQTIQQKGENFVEGRVHAKAQELLALTSKHGADMLETYLAYLDRSYGHPFMASLLRQALKQID